MGNTPDTGFAREYKQAFQQGADALAQFFRSHPDAAAHVDAPIFFFDSPAIVAASGRGLRSHIEVLLANGANINAKSSWWAGGFGVLDNNNHEMAEWLIARGAKLDAYSASRHGMMERLREFVANDPQCVHMRGGDGQTPLHVARTVEVAEFLLDHGADIDARDVDHESTPAQYMMDYRQNVARYLIKRGCQTDILMAAALGDLELVRKHLQADPACVKTFVGAEYFPMRDPHAGGTIYIWTLGKNRTAHRLALKSGHRDVYDLLLQYGPDEQRLAWVAEDNDTAGVRAMLEAGAPVHEASQELEATALHLAAWNGNVEMLQMILKHDPPIQKRDPHYNATPFQWAMHGSLYANSKTGDYATVARLLLEAGAKPPEEYADEMSEAMRGVVRQWRSRPKG